MPENEQEHELDVTVENAECRPQLRVAGHVFTSALSPFLRCRNAAYFAALWQCFIMHLSHMHKIICAYTYTYMYICTYHTYVDVQVFMCSLTFMRSHRPSDPLTPKQPRSELRSFAGRGSNCLFPPGSFVFRQLPQLPTPNDLMYIHMNILCMYIYICNIHTCTYIYLCICIYNMYMPIQLPMFMSFGGYI